MQLQSICCQGTGERLHVVRSCSLAGDVEKLQSQSAESASVFVLPGWDPPKQVRLFTPSLAEQESDTAGSSQHNPALRMD